MTDALHFVDSNIPMYAAGSDHPLKEPCVSLLRAVATRRIRAVTNVEVCQEILHRYSAHGERGRAVTVAEKFMTVIPNVLPVTRDEIEMALELHRSYASVPTRDLVHAAVMRANGVRRIVSADRHFDQLPEVVRIDPLTWFAGHSASGTQFPAM